MGISESRLNEIIRRAQAGTSGRRVFIQRGAFGAAGAAMALRSAQAFAQDGTPSPAASPSAGGEVVRSITREEAQAAIDAQYPPTADAAQGGTFILGDGTDISTLNPILSDNNPTSSIRDLIFETLVDSDPVSAEYIPGLADSWEISADGLTYTYFLNQNVTWHDGTPFTAADVIFSFEAQADPETGSQYTATFNDAVAGWEQIDDYTVRVTAKAQYAPIVWFSNTFCPIIARHLWQDIPHAEWEADPGSTAADPARVIGTGPFRFVEWVQGERVSLIRNDTYWGKVPNVDEFVFVVWPDDATAIEALRAGDIDAYEQVPAADVESIDEADSTDVVIFDTFNFRFYGYNMDPAKTPLFQEREVRQALFYALDRQSIVDNIIVYGTVAQGTQGTLSPAYAPDQIRTQYGYDPVLAAQMLDGAGWVDSGDGVRAKDGVRLEFEVMYGEGSAELDAMVAYMQEAWAEIGVAMTPNPVDFNGVLVPAITENYDYQVALLGFLWDTNGDQSAMFSSTSYGNGFNFMRYSNPEVDRLNMEANQELDPERRVQLLIEASNLVNDDLPVGIISFTQRVNGFGVNVRDWHPNPYAGPVWNLPYVWIEQ